MELAFGGLNLGDVPSRDLQANHCRATDVEVADQVAIDLLPRRYVARDVGQARDIMALQAAVQRRAAEMRYRRLQGIQAVVQRQ
jgi:hypothetical protein